MDKIAVIDLGSNSVRLVLAHILPSGHFVVFDEIKETLRLGQEMEKDGYLKPGRIQQTIRTLKMFRKMCDSNDVDKVYAIATNAVRRAKNQKSFLEEINATCGFRFRVLSEDEESTLIYHGVVNSLDIPKGVIVDISGSSIQIIQYTRRVINNRINLPFGGITLNDMVSTMGLTPEEQARYIVDYVSAQLENVPWLRTLEPDVQFIGVGGSFRNLAKISQRFNRYPLEMIHNYTLTVSDFNSIFDMVKVLDADKRTRIKGLSSERADIFASSLACIKGFLDFSGLPTITVSGCGIREGIMCNHAVPSTVDKPISDVLGHSIYSRLHYTGQNIAHAEQVYQLAIQLFKELRVLHKQPRMYVRVLKIAALMHDFGNRIKFYGHNKHTFYYILNSNLYGATHREIVLAAFVVMAHSQEEFNVAEWQRYRDVVREEDIVAVRRLGVLLRIAESLDRAMCGGVKSLKCDILGDAVIMKTSVEGDCSLEISSALKAGGDFAKAFKKNLEII